MLLGQGRAGLEQGRREGGPAREQARATEQGLDKSKARHPAQPAGKAATTAAARMPLKADARHAGSSTSTEAKAADGRGKPARPAAKGKTEATAAARDARPAKAGADDGSTAAKAARKATGGRAPTAAKGKKPRVAAKPELSDVETLDDSNDFEADALDDDGGVGDEVEVIEVEEVPALTAKQKLRTSAPRKRR